MSKGQSLQEPFLNALRRERVPVAIYLVNGIKLQGQTCVQCHIKDTRVYPDIKMIKTIANLEQSLATGTRKEQGRALGTLAVQACARCHGTHRIAYDNRKIFVDGPNWREVIKH